MNVGTGPRVCALFASPKPGVFPLGILMMYANVCTILWPQLNASYGERGGGDSHQGLGSERRVAK